MFGWIQHDRSRPHPDVQELAGVLRAIEDVLRKERSTSWAKEVARCAELLEKSDVHGVDRFLKLYGGMGSVNDIVLYRDGVLLTEENDRLHRLLSEANDLGQRLRT